MDPKSKIDQLDYKTLIRSLIHLKLSRNNVDSKSEAIDTIQNYFESKKIPFLYKCNNCELEIPDSKRCPWCGAELEYDEKEQRKRLLDLKRGIPRGLYKGSVRGRPRKVDKDVTGKRLLTRLIALLGIPADLVRRNKTYTTLLYYGDIFAQCYPGVRSLRVKTPYRIRGFDIPEGIVFVNLDCSHHGMLSRISIEKFEQVPLAVNILAQMVTNLKNKRESGE